MSFQFEARFFRSLLDQWGSSPKRLLVIGCGPGEEMSTLARETGAEAFGVDLDVGSRSKGARVHLVRSDARNLPFRGGTFDAVYCYHVLEHVPGPAGAVAEARRVLREQGVGYFGTPNKSRLVGYLGGRGTRMEKFVWNLHDYRRRLLGRWSNEQGAHAGFTSAELGGLLQGQFQAVENVGLPYYLGKYPRLAALWSAAFRSGIAAVLCPSVYFRVR